MKIEDKATFDAANVKLFKVAGLFDKWTCDETKESIFSYTIITFESNEALNWLHHRTPAVLETDEQVDAWLNVAQVPAADALKVLTQPMDMVWHEVSNFVNNSRNKTEQCNKRLAERKAGPRSKMMQMWLKKEPQKNLQEKAAEKRVKKEETADSLEICKKPKLEEF